MYNNYLQETAIEISIGFSVKTYNNSKMIDMMVLLWIVDKMWIVIQSDD